MLSLVDKGRLAKLQVCLFDASRIRSNAWTPDALLEVFTLKITPRCDGLYEVWVSWTGSKHRGPKKYQSDDEWRNIVRFINDLRDIDSEAYSQPSPSNMMRSAN